MTYHFNKVYINEKYSFLGSGKYEPIVKGNTDEYIEDYYLNQRTIELCEAEYQRIVIDKLIEKSNISKNNVDLIINGDLQNQILASTLSVSNKGISSLGIYSACATFIEGLIIASMFVNNTNSNIMVVSSSHNLVSEKQFRFPVEYGALRRKVNTCTASGSVAALVSRKKSNIKIESCTIGKIIQTNHKDTNDMGSAMASSCYQTIRKHFQETKRNYDYYDLIITGDLGIYGIDILKELFNDIDGVKLNNIIDAGSIFYKESNIYAGASGPVCLPLVLFDYILNKFKYKKILVVATGSLHSTTSTNLNIEIPSMSHAISLEVK
jgi:stage V sporulation protein AD